MLKPAFQPFLLAVVFGLLAWRESHQPWFAETQRDYIEWLQANADAKTTAAPVVLVEIHDDPRSNEGKGPWQPVDFAIALNTMAPLQPAVLAIAPLLAWPSEGNAPTADREQYLHILHDKLLATAKPLLAARLGFPEDPDIQPPVEAVPVLRKISGDISLVPEYPLIAEKPDESLRLAGMIGFLANDKDPAFQSLIFRYHGQITPSFVLQAAVLWAGVTLDDVRVKMGKAIEIGDAVRIPIDAAGRVAVNGNASFQRLNFDDMMVGVTKMQNGQPSEFPAGSWKKNIALLARATPKDSVGEQLAAALATITTKAFPRPASLLLEIACLLPLCWLVSVVGQWSRHTGLLVIVFAALAYAVLVLSVYGTTSIALPLLAPLALLLLASIVTLATRRAV